MNTDLEGTIVELEELVDAPQASYERRAPAGQTATLTLQRLGDFFDEADQRRLPDRPLPDRLQLLELLVPVPPRALHRAEQLRPRRAADRPGRRRDSTPEHFPRNPLIDYAGSQADGRVLGLLRPPRSAAPRPGRPAASSTRSCQRRSPRPTSRPASRPTRSSSRSCTATPTGPPGPRPPRTARPASPATCWASTSRRGRTATAPASASRTSPRPLGVPAFGRTDLFLRQDGRRGSSGTAMTRPTDSKRSPTSRSALIALVVTVFGVLPGLRQVDPVHRRRLHRSRRVFEDAQSIRAKSPVRVAGVDVGKVTEVEHLTDEDGEGLDAAVVTMTIKDEGRPIREDATMQLRPRLFLEGNLFVDVQPGSPSADELESGDVIPLEQTSTSVQFDQVLTSLQKPVREDLQLFLKEFGDGLDTSDGAEGFREFFRTSPGRLRLHGPGQRGPPRAPSPATSPASSATSTPSSRRSTATRSSSRTSSPTSGSSPARSRPRTRRSSRRSPSSTRPLAEGRPALAKLNAAFPPLRAFSREALPGRPGRQHGARRRQPVGSGSSARWSRRRSCAAWSRTCARRSPSLARLAQADAARSSRSPALLSSCFNEVIIPWSNTDVPAAEDRADDGRLQEHRLRARRHRAARAARATPTASTSASAPAAARPRPACVPDRQPARSPACSATRSPAPSPR